MASAKGTTTTATGHSAAGASEQATPKGGLSVKGGGGNASAEAKQPPKPCWRKICDSGPLGVMCFYLLKWHSRIAILFGYTSLLLVTMVLLCCSDYFTSGFPGTKSNNSSNSTTSASHTNLTTSSTSKS